MTILATCMLLIFSFMLIDKTEVGHISELYTFINNVSTYLFNQFSNFGRAFHHFFCYVLVMAIDMADFKFILY